MLNQCNKCVNLYSEKIKWENAKCNWYDHGVFKNTWIVGIINLPK